MANLDAYLFGRQSKEIRTLQQQLAVHGFYAGTVDGIFGRETVKAVMAAQAHFGDVITGVVDLALLVQLGVTVPPERRAGPLDNPIIRFGLGVFLDKLLKGSPMLSFLDGKKTYLSLAIGTLAILVNHFVAPIPALHLNPDDWLTQLGALIPLATIRSAIPLK